MSGAKLKRPIPLGRWENRGVDGMMGAGKLSHVGAPEV